MNFDEFNRLDASAAYDMLYQCCSSSRWATLMTESRPFENKQSIQQMAIDHWNTMQREDVLEAFDGHPKIGDPQSLKEKYAKTLSQASQEQSAMTQASDEVIQQLADYNHQYEDKFGYIFIVFATGKSASQMLSLIKQRIHNSAEQELTNAAVEQSKITALRLDKLFE